MSHWVAYPDVLAQAHSLGMRCVYHNAAAFAFDRPASVQHVGWASTDDPTIRPEARQWLRRIPATDPAAAIAAMAQRCAQTLASLAHEAWFAPKSHWAHELTHGNGRALSPWLRSLGLDPAPLAAQPDAAAVAIDTRDTAALTAAVALLLTELAGSDFAVLLPGIPLLVTIHHHRQIWWSTPDPAIAQSLRADLPLW